MSGAREETYLPRLVFPIEIRDELFASLKGKKS